MSLSRFLLLFFPAALLFSQAQKPQDNVDVRPAIERIQDRLDALERENRQLLDELRELRKDLEAARVKPQPEEQVRAYAEAESSASPLPERVAVVEARTAEQAQTKVEASQKFPISLNGMLLFNAFSNSKVARSPASTYELLTGPSRAGATVTQSQLGVGFQGPRIPGGGRISGSLTMDFYGGYMSGDGAESDRAFFRIREADLSFDWRNRSFAVGQYKPLIAPLSPQSMAEVAIPPLSGAGNLWLWLPQARYEERLHLNTNNGLTAQVALLQTNEQYASTSAEYSSQLAGSRPALEGRFAFWHKFDDTRKVELAPGFHVSTTHVAGVSIPSRIASLDWTVTALSKLQFTGTFYRGQNVASLGSLGNGFTLQPNYSAGTTNARAVHTSAGWAQISLPLTKRLTFNVFSGLENDDRALSITRNWTYASNVLYHLGPNVVMSFEGLQMRIKYVSGSTLVVNRYDLGVAYLF